MTLPWVHGRSEGSGTFVLAGWVFLRLLGLIYLAAFVSLAVQIKGLVGSAGILPAKEFLAARKHWGAHRFQRLPTLCWGNASDGFLMFLAWGGAALAALLIAGFAPCPVLILLWGFYLSLFTIGRFFLAYQWDTLLLEAGFLAIFFAPQELAPVFPPRAEASPVILWLYWWLLFRLIFSSGVVKLRSSDSTWRRLTALRYHFETQPLPTPLAWSAHQLPIRIHRAAAALLLAIELGAPFLIAGPPLLRHVTAASLVLLMALIQLTGNYSFFNLLGIALSVLLLDDKLLLPVFRWAAHGVALAPAPPSPRWLDGIAAVVAVVVLSLSMETLRRLFRIEVSWPKSIAKTFEFLEPFRLVNAYGLFAVMTIERPEIIVEGSNDGAHWLAYEFKWKPGDVRRAPRFVAPHQPRLDWQMWFAALGYYPNHPWFGRFLRRLLEGSPAVLGLLRTNPFPDKPPRLVRGVLYDYRFTSRAQRRTTRAWWRRERRGSYSPVFESYITGLPKRACRR